MFRLPWRAFDKGCEVRPSPSRLDEKGSLGIPPMGGGIGDRSALGGGSEIGPIRVDFFFCLIQKTHQSERSASPCFAPKPFFFRLVMRSVRSLWLSHSPGEGIMRRAEMKNIRKSAEKCGNYAEIIPLF